MKKPLVSIIILTYGNQLSHIKRCLQSLKSVTFSSYEIILVDNASTDNTVSYIKKYFPKIILLESKTNLGFAEGNNVGLRKSKGEYVLFLNNDVEVTQDFLDPLVDILQKDKTVGVVQPKIRQLLEKDTLDACASFLTNTGFLYHYGYSQKQNVKKYNTTLFMYSAKGACLMTRKDLIAKIGLFDPEYFAYFEETDFCHRVWLSGFSVIYEPRAEIFHLGGATFKGTTPPHIQFNSYKNRITTYIKNLGTKELLFILPVHVICCLGVAMLYGALGKFVISKEILKAFWWNLRHLKKIIKKRKNIQKNIRRVPDSQFISKIKHNAPFSYYKHFLLDPRGKYSDLTLKV